MTDPVDTDELLALGDELEIRWPVREELQVLIRSTAAEVHRLRAEIMKAIRDSRAATKAAEYERGRAEGYEREIGALVAVIESAPHNSFCIADLPSGKHECICWKAEIA